MSLTFKTGTETRHDYQTRENVTFHTVSVCGDGLVNGSPYPFRRFATESEAAEFVRFLERQGLTRDQRIAVPSFPASCEEFRALSEANPKYVYFVSRMVDGTVKSSARLASDCEDLEVETANMLADTCETSERRAFHMGQTVSRS